VPSVWKALHDFRVDLYIASFPYGGGLTLIEAMGAGVPVVLHRHIFSRVLSGIELAYSEAFSWRSPEELLDYCTNVSVEVLHKHARLSRKQYEANHRRGIIEEQLTNHIPTQVTPADLSTMYVPDYDEWACWVEGQLSVRRVIGRASYRLFRRLRTML